MPTNFDPAVSSWYRVSGQNQPFTVLAVNEDDATVEIQYLDGDSMFIDIDEWYDMEINSLADADATGAIDLPKYTDLDYPQGDMSLSEYEDLENLTAQQDEELDDEFREADLWERGRL
jgi:hypothetical protein